MAAGSRDRDVEWTVAATVDTGQDGLGKCMHDAWPN